MFSRILVVSTIAVLTLLVVPAAQSDNYGCVSKAQCTQMERLVLKRFGHGWEGRTALRVFRCESGLNPRAANWSDTRGGSFGLAQINGAHGPGGYATKAWIKQMMVPWRNLVMAYRISRGGKSWGAWACY